MAILANLIMISKISSNAEAMMMASTRFRVKRPRVLEGTLAEYELDPFPNLRDKPEHQKEYDRHDRDNRQGTGDTVIVKCKRP